jgi:NAD(P)-dependent dehydrogenase (short-subunit alcohol dehydrogenase family)
MRLEGKVVAITGAGRGIGRAAAELFAKEGAQVAILELDEVSGRDAEKTIRDAGGTATFIQTDVSDEESVRSAFAEVDRVFGGLHVLYNNASVYLGKHDTSVTKLDSATWRKVLGINLDSVFFCSKYGIPLMIRGGGGSVINTSSSAGQIGIPFCDSYTATKGGTTTLTRSMAVEYGPHGVRVNCIAPAAIQTDMVRESNLDNPDFDEALFIRSTPLRRWGTPEEVARIALFLASDDSTYMNGAVLVADGGITLVCAYHNNPELPEGRGE